jgi:hypothetical protein
LDAYREAFETLGYSVCNDDSLEEGIEKVAIFLHPAKGPSHAARQLPSGLWTSKLGKIEDISHPLRQIEGANYGIVALIMCRLRHPATP